MEKKLFFTFPITLFTLYDKNKEIKILFDEGVLTFLSLITAKNQTKHEKRHIYFRANFLSENFVINII